MCLSMKFFEERENELIRFKKLGYIDIQELNKTYKISIEQLMAIHLLEKKTEISTADLYDYKITRKGNSLLYEDPHQLLLLKPNSLNKLNKLLSDSEKNISEVSLVAPVTMLTMISFGIISIVKFRKRLE